MHCATTNKRIKGDDQEMYNSAICRQHFEPLPAAPTNNRSIKNSNKRELECSSLERRPITYFDRFVRQIIYGSHQTINAVMVLYYRPINLAVW
jgi:hypothetical protein